MMKVIYVFFKFLVTREPKLGINDLFSSLVSGRQFALYVTRNLYERMINKYVYHFN